MNTRLVTGLLAAALFACPAPPQPPVVHELAAFAVQVKGVYTIDGSGNRVLLDVVTPCELQYGSQAAVPANVRGTKACRLSIPTSEIQIDVTAQALDNKARPLSFSGPVSFRVLPGDLSGTDLTTRWANVINGSLTATVRAQHTYSEVRVWVEDAPPAPLFDAGVQITTGLPVEPAVRTYAAGASDIVYFGDQTLQSLQNPGIFDNRASPFVGEFVTVGKNPESGEQLLQSCSDDPARDGKPALMVVTGLDPSGFFVSDVSACRLIEQTVDATGATQIRTQEPPEHCQVPAPNGGVRDIEDSGVSMGKCEISQIACAARTACKHYLPSTYAHMFVYNYNFPDGLNEGDLLFTLSGSVQEFTSTTQMVFPAWSVAEHVRLLPPDQWNKWEQFATPVTVNYRICGMDDTAAPFLTDALCGQNKRNLKLESLESGLVSLKNVRFPTQFVNCDTNSDGKVPFFCEQKDPDGNWIWGSCAFGMVEPDADRVERECYQSCVIGTGDHDGKVCSELATFKGFGQYVVEMGMPGPAKFGLDDSLTLRSTPVAIAANGAARLDGYGAGQEVAIACDHDTHYRFGDMTAAAVASDPVISAGQWTPVRFGMNQTSVAFLGSAAAGTCWVGLNVKARINLITQDAIPELNPNCSETDADATKALLCKELHGSTFDLIGHLKQVQPGRPRWIVVPRSVDDVCCHPGQGLSCPAPIKACQ